MPFKFDDHLFVESVAQLIDLETPTSREEDNSAMGEKLLNLAKSRSCTESKPGTSFTNFSVPSPTKEEQEEEAKIQSMMEKYPETIPIIDEMKEEKTSTDLKVKGKASQAMKTDSQTRKQSGKKRDMSHVLSYLKKNKYDDTGRCLYVTTF